MKIMKNTLLVNLYAGPGAGKSTGAAYIFSKLKMAGIDSEYVSEYAKDRVWQGDQFVLQHCQLYVTGKQCLKVARLLGKVDVIVTDSPIAIGAMYTDEKPYQDVCLYEAKKYKNTFNIFINRKKDYNPNGRNQTFEEAKTIDQKILDFLDTNKLEEASDIANENVASESVLKDGYGSFTIYDADQDDSLFISIPSNPGWEVTCNGKKVEPDKISGLFMSIPLEKGQNDIEMRYKTPFLTEGVIGSISGLVLLAVVVIFEEISTRRSSRTRQICKKHS